MNKYKNSSINLLLITLSIVGLLWLFWILWISAKIKKIETMENNINSKKLKVVYFACINPKFDWKIILEGQFTEMKNSGMIDDAEIFLILSAIDTQELKEEVMTVIEKYFTDKTNYHVEIHEDNKYEYYGIKKLYDLGKEDPSENNYLLYFHSKGMFNYVLHKRKEDLRDPQEIALTATMIKNWKEIVTLLDDDVSENKYDKVCFARSDDNTKYCWFNFFFVKGSYINTCEEPIISEDRFYYEKWLGTGNKNAKTFSLESNSDSVIYNSDAAWMSLQKKIKELGLEP